MTVIIIFRSQVSLSTDQGFIRERNTLGAYILHSPSTYLLVEPILYVWLEFYIADNKHPIFLNNTRIGIQLAC
jgi:hypothetical protein